VSAPPSEAELLAAAARLCAGSGQAAPVALAQLAGGKNNRVFRLDLVAGPALVLKSYHIDPRDPRDRLAAEWTFLNYVWTRGVRVVPRPIARDDTMHLGLYTMLPGRKIAASEIGDEDIKQAAAFVVAANGNPRDVMALAPGSEACFSITQHLATVTRRVQRLTTLDDTAPDRQAAEALVADRLVPAWNSVLAQIHSSVAALRIDPAAELSPLHMCVSPSDFGFHNALRDARGQLGFLDFEYAGRDDPAKLVCDFFCCPEIPVPTAQLGPFMAHLSQGFATDAEFRQRCELLLDAYRIKWACIALNDFLPVGAARRDFAEVGSRALRYRQQLAKAEAKLQEIPLH
jgi:hypothetical protein